MGVSVCVPSHPFLRHFLFLFGFVFSSFLSSFLLPVSCSIPPFDRLPRTAPLTQTFLHVRNPDIATTPRPWSLAIPWIQTLIIHYRDQPRSVQNLQAPQTLRQICIQLQAAAVPVLATPPLVVRVTGRFGPTTHHRLC